MALSVQVCLINYDILLLLLTVFSNHILGDACHYILYLGAVGVSPEHAFPGVCLERGVNSEAFSGDL